MPVFRRRFSLGENIVHHFAVYIGEAIPAALVFVGESFVVDAKQVQQGGLKVMDVNGVLGGVHTKGVAGTIGDARPHAAAGHPSREGVRVMIAAPLLAVFHVALQKGRAAKFTAPNDERVIQ